MAYSQVHKRRVRGGAVHETLAQKRVNSARAKTQESYSDVSSAERKELGKEKVESEYLIPTVENWVGTEQIKVLKERIKNWLWLKKPVHIIGPTGCGKTTLALQVAKEIGRPTVWINGDESITTTDLIGGYSQVETTSIRDKYIHNVFKDKDILKADWVDNPLTLACKYGYTLIYNEFSRSRAAANNVLLSIFSEGILELPTQFSEERYVKVHPEFRAIFISNPVEYAGVHKAQDALLDRMVGIYMNYYDMETEAKIIAAQSGIQAADATSISKMLHSLRAKLPMEDTIGMRAGIMVAQFLKSVNKFDKPAIKQLLADIMTSKTRDKEDFNKKIQVIQSL